MGGKVDDGIDDDLVVYWVFLGLKWKSDFYD